MKRRLIPSALLLFLLLSACSSEPKESSNQPEGDDDPPAQQTMAPSPDEEANGTKVAIKNLLSSTYEDGSYDVKLSSNSYTISLTVGGALDRLKADKAAADEYIALSSSLAQTVTDSGESKRADLYVYDTADPKAILLTISNGKILFDGSAEQEEGNKSSGVTKFQFDAISSGMSYQDVVSVFGSNGTMDASTDLGMGDTFTSEVYSWKGENPYSTVSIVFSGGQVVTKSQVGLG